MCPRNRGKHPNDNKLFSDKWHSILTAAVDDLCHLLTKGYAINASLQLVGNRYKLNKRQRIAINRLSCSEEQKVTRTKSKIAPIKIKNQNVAIDGFNLLILIESALSGGYILRTREGVYRDMSSVHSTYRRVHQTDHAIRLIGQTLHKLGANQVKWYLDSPVSNSGRLKSFILQIGNDIGMDWEVELAYNPDKELVEHDDYVVVTSDGLILDKVVKWCNLGGYIIERHISDAEIVDV